MFPLRRFCMTVPPGNRPNLVIQLPPAALVVRRIGLTTFAPVPVGQILLEVPVEPQAIPEHQVVRVEMERHLAALLPRRVRAVTSGA